MKSAEIMPVPSQPVVPASAAKVEKAPGIVSETARRFSANRLSMLGLLVVVADPGRGHPCRLPGAVPA